MPAKSQVSGPGIEGIIDGINVNSSVANKERIDWTVPLAVDPAFYDFVKGQVDSAYFDTISKKCTVIDDRSDPPYPPLPRVNYEKELANINDKLAASRGEFRPPSISIFTLHNTFRDVISADFSAQSNLLYTGSRNSHIDVWSVDSARMRTLKPSTELAAISYTDDTQLDDIFEESEYEFARLIGHSGPVYRVHALEVANCPFLLSCSQDSSAILWSASAMCSVARYKGHSQPVWSLDAAPRLPYFATCSADKTARMWTTESITSLRIFVGHFSDVDVCRVLSFHVFRLSSFIPTANTCPPGHLTRPVASGTFCRGRPSAYSRDTLVASPTFVSPPTADTSSQPT